MSPRLRYSFLLLLALFGARPAEAVVYLSGTMTVSATGAPLAGAEVSLYPATQQGITPGATDVPVDTTRSLPNGTYVLKAPEPGSYRLWATSEPNVPLSRTVVVPTAGLARYDLPMGPPPAMHFKVNGTDGHALQGGTAETWVRLRWGSEGGMVLPGNVAGGAPELSLTAAGKLDVPAPPSLPLESLTSVAVEIQVPGRGSSRVVLPRWPAEDVAVNLEPGATIAGRVVAPTGKPLVGVSVRVQRMLQDGVPLLPARPSRAVTDASGHFLIKGFFHDRYDIEADVPGQPVGPRPVLLTAETTTVTLTPGGKERARPPLPNPFGTRAPLDAVVQRVDPRRLRSMVIVAGRVVDRVTGFAVPDTAVLLYTLGQAQPVSLRRSGPDGAYQLSALPSREYGLRVEHSQYLVIQQTLKVATSGQSNLLLPLRRVPVLQLKVLGDDGRPLAAGPIEAYVVASWGQTLAETALAPAVSADGQVQVTIPVTEVTPGAPSSDEPRDIIIGVRRSAAGYAQAEFSTCPDGPVTVTLRPAIVLAGVVLNPAGKPIPRQAVTVTRTSHYPGPGVEPPVPLAADTVTDDRGHFQVLALPPGTYSILTAYGGATVRAEIVALTPGSGSVTVRPPR